MKPYSKFLVVYAVEGTVCGGGISGYQLVYGIATGS